MSYTPDPRVNAAIDAQARLIAEELRRRGMSFGSRTPAQVLHRLDTGSGELVVGLIIGDFTYHEVNGELIVQREAKGRLEWTRVGEDSEPIEPWEGIAPPPSRSATN